MAGYQSGFGNTFECPPRRTPPVRSCSGCRERPRRDWVIRESRVQRLTPCSSIGRLSLAEWIGLTACVRGDSWSATSGAEQPAGKSNDSRPFRVRTQGAMPRCAHTSSTRSNSRGLHSRARGRRISARGYIASAPAWYARALDFSRITAHISSQRRDMQGTFGFSTHPEAAVPRLSVRLDATDAAQSDAMASDGRLRYVLEGSLSHISKEGRDAPITVQAGTRKISSKAG